MAREPVQWSRGAGDASASDASPPSPAPARSPLLGELLAVGSAARARRPSVLLPICAYCKRIRAGGADATPGAPSTIWGPFESVVFSRGDHTGFTHSVCPECYEREIVPQLERLKHKRSGLAAG